MTLAARCPHCTTTFRLSSGHLAAAQGWVRCGVCQQAFEATEHLCTEEGEPLVLPALQAAADPAPQPSMQPLPDIDLELPDLGPLQEPDRLSETVPDLAAADLSAVDPSAPRLSAPHRGDVPAKDSAAVSPEITAEVVPEISRALGPETAPPIASAIAADTTPDVPSTTASAASVLSTVPADHMEAPSSAAPSVRPEAANESPPAPAAKTSSAGTWALAALLLTALLLQAAYASRGWLVQAVPESRPVVLQMCDILGCTMPPVRSLQGLTITGSSLSLDADDGLHRLGVTLSNASELPAQAPALELTLLDGEGTVLARRALLPEEFSPVPQAIAARGDLSLQVQLDLKSLQAGAISTFRLAPFYP